MLIMKKIFKIGLGLLVISVLFSLFIKDDKKEVVNKEPDTNIASTETDPVEKESDNQTVDSNLINPYEGRKAEIYDIAHDRIKEGEYPNVTITDIKLNDNLGSPEDGDFILLINGTFDIKNSKDTGNNVLKMYANDLVATVANNGVTEVFEAAIFWKDDYNNRTVKYAYEYNDGEFSITDIMGE